MATLVGLGGTATLMLVCLLLFLEEAGIPLPVPGDLALAAGGLVVAEGELAWWIFIPAAWLASSAGALVGYGWARAVGLSGPRTIARWLHAEQSCERVIERVRGARSRAIATTRLVPGLRIYTTLACGAAGVDPLVFLAGAVPATCVWVVGYTTAGALLGIPALRFLGGAETVVLHGAVVAFLVLGLYIALRRYRRHLG